MNYDLIIIGSGWAGFQSACEAKELGFNVALIEKEELGGTCLNRGCIPTKSLVHACTILHNAKNSANFGFEINQANISIEKIIQKKNDVVAKLKRGMSSTLKTKDITYIKGKAKILDKNRVALDNGQTLESKYIIIATGSVPRELSILKFDHNRILSSQDLLNINTIPKNLLIVGGGVIGCEFAHIFNSLGSNVTIIELTNQLIPLLDKEAARKIEIIFKKRSIRVYLATDVTNFRLDEFDKILICIGRTPNIKGLGLENLKLDFDRDRIKVNGYLQTNIPNIFAAGDCSSIFQLAHIASYEGKTAVYNIYSFDKTSTLKFKTNYRAVPNCIFTEPQIAAVGLTDEQARQKGIDVKLSKFQFLASGMAHVLEQTEGFIKLVVDKKTDLLLGGVIIGPKATELINILTLAINCDIKAADISKTIFAHPSLSEIIAESTRLLYAAKLS